MDLRRIVEYKIDLIASETSELKIGGVSKFNETVPAGYTGTITFMYQETKI